MGAIKKRVSLERTNGNGEEEMIIVNSPQELT